MSFVSVSTTHLPLPEEHNSNKKDLETTTGKTEKDQTYVRNNAENVQEI